MYLVQASPLSKIFLPQYQAQCLKDPKFIFNGDEFTVTVKRPCGNVILKHGKPVHVATLIPKVKSRQVEEDELTPLFDWLTDEQNNETDMYGIVGVSIESDVSTAIQTLVSNLGDELILKEQFQLLKDLRSNLSDSIKDARKRADLRVRKHCKQMYNTVKETHDFMQKEGNGIYSPSYSEGLAMDILKDEIIMRRAPDLQNQTKFNETMSALSQQV